MGRRALVLIGPASSIGSPITFIMRPSVSTPTGTVIELSVSRTAWPRTKPSVESIAMVRTVFSPKCCATSNTKRFSPFMVSSALRIFGRSPSKATSTTAPVTCVTRPVAPLRVEDDIAFLAMTVCPYLCVTALLRRK